VSRFIVVLAASWMGALACCTTTDGILPAASGPPPPPAALLEPPSMGAGPVDPRFAHALTVYAAALSDLGGYDGSAFFAHLHATLRLLADAVALVPASPALRQPAYRAANEVRSDVAEMEILLIEDPRGQVETARRALVAAAELLRGVAEREYGSSAVVLAAAGRFVASARAIAPDRPRAELVGALRAAEAVLEAMLRAAIAEAR
jgi:hypothetical protein